MSPRLPESGVDRISPHHPNDLNIDHGIVAHVARTAPQPLPGSPVREVLAGEIREWPHPRSAAAVADLARLRGSECGIAAAEALMNLRRVRRLG